MLQSDFANVPFTGREAADLPQSLPLASGGSTQLQPQAPALSAPAQNSEAASGAQPYLKWSEDLELHSRTTQHY